MITLVLQDVVSASDEQGLRTALAGQEGIEVLSWNGPDVFHQPTLDAIILDAWKAGELFAVPRPSEPAEVVLDSRSGKRAFLHSATVASARNPRRTVDVSAPWIVRSAALRLVESAPPLSDDEVVFATVMNALEVMERHNDQVSSSADVIQSAGIQVSLGWAEGLAHAYRVYREQASTNPPK